VSIRVGVDVGGTFTKAVACDSGTGGVVARAVVPTTHSSVEGIGRGIVEAIGQVTEEVKRHDLGDVELIAHSTTQAVNALLEGDTSIVGIIGIGRRPDLKRARKRTAVGEVRLAPGRSLLTRHAFIDATGGIDETIVRAAIHDLTEEGAEVLCLSEAFGVDDARAEWLALEIAHELGIPACAGHELTGLYGLEMRTVTAALNASILPTALKTASLVEKAARDLTETPLLVMRGDGGVVNLEAMKRHPLLTAFSGPAASVAGALRRTLVHDGVVIEVGGTSTNVSSIKAGRPVLSYVRVLGHVTCVRSLDVRVVGVAGGSLARIGRRFGRPRLVDVGPRSAHIAALSYASFEPITELENAVARLIAPRPGDPAEYVVLETTRGRQIALTLTCAANALDTVPVGSYARGDSAAARRAFEIAGAFLGLSWRGLAEAFVQAATHKIAGAVSEAIDDAKLQSPAIVGLGGGAGALIPAVAASSGTPWSIPADAEVISSIGDALSLIRVEVERTLARPSAQSVASLHREAEAAALRAGAAAGTIQLESEAVPERGALRVTAYGSVALDARANGFAEVGSVDLERGERTARDVFDHPFVLVAVSEFFAVYASETGEERRFVVVDSNGSMAAQGRGRVIAGVGREVGATLAERVPALTRHYGPIAVAPAVRVVRGPRLVDLTLISKPEEAVEAAIAECELAGDEEVVALVSRS
jgi:N-methylhydantoinase A